MNGQKQISEDSKELGSSKDSKSKENYQKKSEGQLQFSMHASGGEKSITEEEEKEDDVKSSKVVLQEHPEDNSSSS